MSKLKMVIIIKYKKTYNVILYFKRKNTNKVMKKKTFMYLYKNNLENLCTDIYEHI